MSLAQAVAGSVEARKYILSLLESASSPSSPAASPPSSPPPTKRKRADEAKYDLATSALEAKQFIDVALVSLSTTWGREVEREASMKLLDYGESLVDRFPSLKSRPDPQGHRTLCFSFFKTRFPLTLLICRVGGDWQCRAA
jgi:hypothetical protein